MPKTIVITGTATGMGRATVSKFAAAWWNGVATVRTESDLKAHDGLRCVNTVLMDVDDETAAVPFARLALEQFGGVDALVNNAGYYQMGPLEGTSMEQVHRQYQTNVFSIAALIKAFLPAFPAPRSGMIIDIAYPTAARYYSAADSVSIPRAKRILGADGYWQEFRCAVLGHPSALWKTLVEKPGSTPVDIEA